MNRNGPLALALPRALRRLHAGADRRSSASSPSRPKASSRSRPTEWSLRWFEAIARYPEFVSAFWNSLGLAALSSAIAVAFSVPAALAIARHRFRGREALTALFLSPLMIPHVVLGIAFLRFFTQIGLGGTFTGLVHRPRRHRLSVRAAPGARLGGRHGPRARARGRSRSAPAAARVFRRVTLPLILPGVASGWMLAFIRVFDEVTMTVFIAAPGHRDAAGAHVPLHPGQHRSAGDLGLGRA